VKRLAAYGEPVEGTPFGRYRLIECGVGEVWRAHDTATNNRTVGITLLPPQLAADHSAERRTNPARILQDVRRNLGHDRPQRPVAAKNSDHHKSARLDRGHDD
jgi:hypothetical protein